MRLGAICYAIVTQCLFYAFLERDHVHIIGIFIIFTALLSYNSHAIKFACP